MSRGILAVALFVFCFTAAALHLPAEAKPPKVPGIQDDFAGVIPNEWGKLTTVSGTAKNYTLVFETAAGEIRIIDLRGRHLPQKCTLVKRRY